MPTQLTRADVEAGNHTIAQVLALIDERDAAVAEVKRVTEAATVAYEVAESERKELEQKVDALLDQHDEDTEFIDSLGQICCGVAFTNGQYEEANEYARTHSECAFCGEFGPRTPEAMNEHIRHCSKRPEWTVIKERDAAIRERDEARAEAALRIQAHEEMAVEADDRAEKAEAMVAALREALTAQGLVNEHRVGRTGREAGWCIGRCPTAGHSEECEQARATLRDTAAVAEARDERIRAEERAKADGHAADAEALREVLRHVKVRISFVGHPGEPWRGDRTRHELLGDHGPDWSDVIERIERVLSVTNEPTEHILRMTREHAESYASACAGWIRGEGVPARGEIATALADHDARVRAAALREAARHFETVPHHVPAHDAPQGLVSFGQVAADVLRALATRPAEKERPT